MALALVMSLVLLLLSPTSHAFTTAQFHHHTKIINSTPLRTTAVPRTLHRTKIVPNDKISRMPFSKNTIWKTYYDTPWQRRTVSLQTTKDNNDNNNNNLNDDFFDGKTTLTLIGAQSLLIVASVVAAVILGTPNYGLGDQFAITKDAVLLGALYSLPLFLLAFVLDFVEKSVPALRDVTLATQRSVLALLGSRRKPVTALATAVGLGLAAGIGEEMLFRGVLQTTLTSRFGDVAALTTTSVLFGALHAVTPLYAVLATLASVFFGVVFGKVGNLAVVMICHGLYDVGALMWAHWTVTGMNEEERREILDFQGPLEQ